MAGALGGTEEIENNLKPSISSEGGHLAVLRSSFGGEAVDALSAGYDLVPGFSTGRGPPGVSGPNSGRIRILFLSAETEIASLISYRLWYCGNGHL